MSAASEASLGELDTQALAHFILTFQPLKRSMSFESIQTDSQTVRSHNHGGYLETPPQSGGNAPLGMSPGSYFMQGSAAPSEQRDFPLSTSDHGFLGLASERMTNVTELPLKIIETFQSSRAPTTRTVQWHVFEKWCDLMQIIPF